MVHGEGRYLGEAGYVRVWVGVGDIPSPGRAGLGSPSATHGMVTD